MQSATGRPGVGITVTRRWAARRAAQLALDLQLTARIVLIFAQQRAAMLDRKIRTGTAVVTVIAAWRIAIIARWRFAAGFPIFARRRTAPVVTRQVAALDMPGRRRAVVIAAWRRTVIARRLAARLAIIARRWRRAAIESGIVTAVLLFFLAARVTTRRRAVNVSRRRTPIGM
jgi:hypothetical protein